ncbi:MAG: hypothetical protein KatS3mg076_2273 [Candidatus Binatia bacterium]|nr:MAG: hypothetical protein KatS3mg076_2273 [Candidatus Binatia bacterium]
MEDTARKALDQALRSILRPLVRELIAHGVTFHGFARLGKEVYIEVASRDFALPFKKQTDSRIALITGLTRKEIGQIRRGRSIRRESKKGLDYGVATRVVSHWVTEKPYVDPRGEPRTLPYEAGPHEPSFARLVDEVGGDIPPRAILDELIRVGVAEMTPEGGVRLLQKAYIPARGTTEKIAILGSDVSELIRAILHNIEKPDEVPFLQRKVAYDNIGADALPRLREKVRKSGADFTAAMNELFASFDRDRNPRAPGGARKRAVLGIYYFDEDYAAESPDAGLGTKRSR